MYQLKLIQEKVTIPWVRILLTRPFSKMATHMKVCRRWSLLTSISWYKAIRRIRNRKIITITIVTLLIQPVPKALGTSSNLLKSAARTTFRAGISFWPIKKAKRSQKHFFRRNRWTWRKITLNIAKRTKCWTPNRLLLRPQKINRKY